MARMVFSKTLDKYPDLKLIVHHFGGIVPMLEGRIGPGWDQLGARTSDEDLHALLGQLKKRPLDYFKHSFYADTAVFGGEPATRAGFEFYDLDKIVFASDCPFDPEKGTMYIRETLRIIEEHKMPAADKEKVWHGNLERMTGKKLSK
jgi:aminocarboxymuconate-semialdehyde decarboxylase